MSQNKPFRFDQGMGLERSVNTRQNGFTQLEDSDLRAAKVIRKRDGAQLIPLTRSATATDLIPQDEVSSIFWREKELILETRESIYSRNTLATGSVAPTAIPGTATPTEISNAKTELNNQESNNGKITVAITTDGNNTAAVNRRLRNKLNTGLVIWPTQGNIFTRLSSPVLGSSSSFLLEFIAADGVTPILSITSGVGSTITDLQLINSSIDDKVWLAFATTNPSNGLIWFSWDLSAGSFSPISSLSGARLPCSFGLSQSAGGVVSAGLISTSNNLTSINFITSSITTYTPAITALPAGTDAILDYTISSSGTTHWWALRRTTTLEVYRGTGTSVTLQSIPFESFSTLGVVQSALSAGDCLVSLPNGVNLRTTSSTNSEICRANSLTTLQHTLSSTGKYRFEDPNTGSLVWPEISLGVTPNTTKGFAAINSNGNAVVRIYFAGNSGVFFSSCGSNTVKLITVTTAQTSTADSRIGRSRSTNRHCAFWINPGRQLSIVTTNPTSTLTTSTQTVIIASGGGLTAGAVVDRAVSMGIFSDTTTGGAARVDGRLVFVDQLGKYNSVTFRGVAGTASENLKQYDFQTAPLYSATIQSGTNPRVIWAVEYTTGSREVYEENPNTNLFVLVDPPTIFLTGGNWAKKGAWTHGVSTEVAGELRANTIRSAFAARFKDERGNVKEINATDTVDSLIANTRGDSVEAVFTIDPIGRDIKGGTPTQDTVVLTYLNTDEIRMTTWSPGITTLPVATAVIANVDVGVYPKRWDFHSDDATGVSAWYAVRTATIQNIICRRANGTMSPLLVVPGTPNWPTRNAAAVWVQPVRTATNDVRIWFASQGTTGGAVSELFIGFVDYNDSANTFGVPVTRLITPYADGTLFALAIAADTRALPGNNNVAIIAAEATGPVSNRVVFRVINVAGSTNIVIGSKTRTCLTGQFTKLPSETYWRSACVLYPLGDPLTNNCQFLYDPVGKSTDVLETGLLGEYVARSFISLSKTSRLAASSQVATNSVCNFNNIITYANATQQTPARLSFVLNGITEVDLTQRLNVPVDVNGVVVSAHAGYPRMYDGKNINEHDWHLLPQIRSLTAGGIGSLTAGSTYGIAVTFEWVDLQGQLYRSQPDFDSIVLGAGQDSIAVEIFVNHHSERRGVEAVVWRTEANGEIYYRDNSIDIGPDNASGLEFVTSTLTQSDANIIDNEQLIADYIGGSQAPITGFIGEAGGRLWGRNPRINTIAQHSLLEEPALGVGRSWDISGVVETMRQLTAVGEVEGNPVFFDKNGITALFGEGPNNVGEGVYPAVRKVPVEVGCTGQETICITKYGLIFGSLNGVRLLSTNLSVQDISEKIERFYEIDGARVVAAAYDPARGEVVILDDGPVDSTNRRTLRYHFNSQRWSSDSNRRGRALSLAKDGRYAILTIDGRVLIQDPLGEGLTYTPYLSARQATGVKPQVMYIGDAQEFFTQDPLSTNGSPTIVVNALEGIIGNNSYNFTGASPQYFQATDPTLGDLGDGESLFFTISYRLTATPTGTDITIVGKRAQSGTPAGYSLDFINTGPRLRLTSTTGVNFDIQLTTLSYQLNVDYDITVVIDRQNGLLRLSSNLESATPVAFNPALSFTNNDRLRLGAVVNTNRSITGQTHFFCLTKDEPAVLAITDTQSVSSQVLAALATGDGIYRTRRTSDGDLGYFLTVECPVRVESQDLKTHCGFRFTKIRFSGEYEGSHSINVKIFKDFNNITPYKQYNIDSIQIDDNFIEFLNNGKPYIMEVPAPKDTFYYARVAIMDGGETNASFILGEIDIEIEPLDPANPGYIEITDNTRILKEV